MGIRAATFTKFKDITRSKRGRYLVDRLIPAADLTVVWGDAKCGKTFWVLDLAMHVAAGREYRGRKVIGGAVFYCTFEGAEAFPDRVFSVSESLGLREVDIPFYYSRDKIIFTKLQKSDLIIDGIKSSLLDDTACQLVVLDTLNRSLEGSESSDEDMTHYTRCAEAISVQLGCAVIIIHHSGLDKSRPRGHTSLTGTCAAQIRVSRSNTGAIVPGQPMLISSRVEFMKDGPEGLELFSWSRQVDVGVDEDGLPIDSCYIEEAPAPDGKAGFGMKGKSQQILSVLQELYADAVEEYVILSAWKAACVNIRLSSSRKKGAHERAFYRAYDDLKETGKITVAGNRVSLTTPDDPK